MGEKGGQRFSRWCFGLIGFRRPQTITMHERLSLCPSFASIILVDDHCTFMHSNWTFETDAGSARWWERVCAILSISALVGALLGSHFLLLLGVHGSWLMAHGAWLMSIYIIFDSSTDDEHSDIVDTSLRVEGITRRYHYARPIRQERGGTRATDGGRGPRCKCRGTKVGFE